MAAGAASSCAPLDSGVAVMDLGAAETALQAARRRRIDGDPYGFYLQLAQAAASLPTTEQGRVDKLQAAARDIGYRGTPPTEDQMDSDLRAIERDLNRRKEETDP
jgi:hypothetical protein